MDRADRNLFGIAFLGLLVAAGAIGAQMQVEGGSAWILFPGSGTAAGLGGDANMLSIDEIGPCGDTDGGANIWVRGSALGTYGNSARYVYTDFCLDGKTVVEYFCGKSFVSSIKYDCAAYGMGCVDGACG